MRLNRPSGTKVSRFIGNRYLSISSWSIKNSSASSRQVDRRLNQSKRTIWGEVIKFYWKSIINTYRSVIDRSKNSSASSGQIEWWSNETERTIWGEVITFYWKSIPIDQWSTHQKNHPPHRNKSMGGRLKLTVPSAPKLSPFICYR